MKKQTRRKKTNNVQSVIFLLIVLAGLMRQIPLTNLIGDDGSGYLAFAYEMGMICLALTAYAIPEATSRLVEARMKSGQFKSAGRIFQSAMGLTVLVSIGAGVVLFMAAGFLAGEGMQEPLALYPLRAFATVLFFASVFGMLNGYFKGLGTRMPEMVSGILVQVLLFFSMILLTKQCGIYGEKAGNLLKNVHFKAAFGAMGSAAGLVPGLLIGILFLGIVYRGYREILKKQEQRDASRNTESFGKSLRLLGEAAIPVFIPVFLYFAGHLIELKLFNHYALDNGLGDHKAADWGVYFGKYRVLTRIAMAAVLPVCLSMLPAVMASVGKADMKQVKDRIQGALHLLFFQSIPWAVGLAVLAKPLTELLYDGETEAAAAMLKTGSLIVVFLPLAVWTGRLLQEIGKQRWVLLHAAAALGVQIGLFFVFLHYLNLHIQAVVYAELAAAVVFAFCNLAAVMRILHYRQEWIRSLCIPAGAAAGAGIAQYLLFTGFSRLMGNPGVLPAFLIGAFLYLIIVLALHGISERELSRLPGGQALTALARAMRLL